MHQGHPDFGQAGFQQQYPFPTSLSSVPSNHDMGKQIAAGQTAMYSAAGGMPSAAPQHHQAPMGGPGPTPVQPGQQMARTGHLTTQAYYASIRAASRPNIPNMPRPITQLVNQGQHTSPQYGINMVPQQLYHNPAGGMLLQYNVAGYPQRPMMPYAHVLGHGQASAPYMNPWNYTNQAPSNSNFFPQQNMYNNGIPQMSQHQQIAQQPVQAHVERKKNILKITNPNTGEDILETIHSKSTMSEKETENEDSNICAQFATQVIVAASEKNDTLSKSTPISYSRVIESENVMSNEMEPPRNLTEIQIGELSDIESHGKLTDVESLGELADTESLVDGISCSDNEAVWHFNKDSEVSTVIEKEFEDTKTVHEDIPLHLTDYEAMAPLSQCRLSPIEDSAIVDDIEPESCSPIDQTDEPQEQLTEDDIQSADEVKPAESPYNISVVSNIAQKTNQKAFSLSESKIQEAEDANIYKHMDKANDAKKNKARKKKDLNKRGESKEGGEMDAYLDSEKEMTDPSPPMSSVTMPATTSSVDRIPSPVPTFDNEILDNIPLPAESFPLSNFQQNDLLPTEVSSEKASKSPTAENEDKENIDDSPKMVLKYEYKEDQWSPLNPEGKKQYDRDFLLQLQSQPMSLCKPTNLPNLDVIKDRAHVQRLNEVNRSMPVMQQTRGVDTFFPVFARTNTPRGMAHPAMRSRTQPRDSKPKKIISFSNLGQQIKLHESENAWKPLAKLETQQELSANEIELEKLKRSVQGVLNKLTPQKFETLLQQIKSFNIDTDEKLNIVIDLTFEKAIDEPNFSVPYANLCKHLASLKVPLAGQPGAVVKFRKLLLVKCQKEFEQDRSDEIRHEEKLKAIEVADPDKKKELQLELDEEIKKMRYRQLGNIRFIGELFKFEMLTEVIMHDCIKTLIKDIDEESLECLCKLLKTIGKELEKGKKENKSMEDYFNTMQKIVDKRLTSSRVRFMLQDVIDLRKNHWVPRRDENNPKTIDQIHKEAEREAREQQLQAMNTPSYPKRVPDDRDRRKNTGRNVGASEDGWMTSSTKASKGSYSVVDPTKLKLTKPDEVESMRLGPGGRGPQSWGKGSSGGTKLNTEPEKTTLTNRYSVLVDAPNYDGRRGFQKSAASSRESSRGRNSGQMTPSSRNPSTAKEKEQLLETVKVLARSSTVEPKTAETKQAPDTHVNGKAISSTELSLRGNDISEEEMISKTKPLIEEFLHNNNDFEEAIRCVTELVSPNTVQFFISSAINQILERSSQARYSLGQLLYFLVKKKIITQEQYKKGFHPVVELIDDFALDVPLIWEYIGEILEPMFEDGEIPLFFLKELLLPCTPSETAGLLVSAVLHCVGRKKGTLKLGEDWKESGLQWTDFLGTKSNVNNFIQKQKLEFTVTPSKAKPTVQLSFSEIKSHLLDLLGKYDENEEIFDWIDINVSDKSHPEFIRALVSAVHEKVIIGNESRYDFDQAKLKSRIPILTQYIGENANSELQALFAIQALMHEYNQPDKREAFGIKSHGPDDDIYINAILRNIIDILYDDEVITAETFKKWEQSKEEPIGKNIALNSVKSFFTWLREDEDPVD